jgi:hypothetical protein
MLLGPGVVAICLAMVASGKARSAGALALFIVALLPWRLARFPTERATRGRAWVGFFMVLAGGGSLFVWGLSGHVGLLLGGLCSTVIGALVMYGRPRVSGQAFPKR